MRLSLLFVVVLLILAAGQTIYYYGQLPATMASHFDGAGQANDWQSKMAFFGIYWLVVALNVGMFVLLGVFLPRIPAQYINLPHKDYWLAPERREASFLDLARQMEWFAVGSLVLLLVIIQMVITTNLNNSAVLPSVPTWITLGAYFVFIAVWMLVVLRRFKKPV